LVNVALLAWPVLRAANQENSLDSVAGGTVQGQRLECVDRRRRSYKHIRVRVESSMGLVPKEHTLGVTEQSILLVRAGPDPVDDLFEDLNISLLEQLDFTTYSHDE
jgi:hypothetical protein